MSTLKIAMSRVPLRFALSQLCGAASTSRAASSQLVPKTDAQVDAKAADSDVAKAKEIKMEREPHPQLDAFFDVKGNWPKLDIVVGGSWTIDLLRRKSNSDLHKLWFILLKERNMLLTMEHEAGKKMEAFPNPERKFRVEESMSALEEVVGERNSAVAELVEGRSSRRPTAYVTSALGLKMDKELDEHPVPHWMNPKARKDYERPLRTEQERSFEAHIKENEREIARNKADDRRRVDGNVRRGLLRYEHFYNHHSQLPKDDDFYQQNF